MVIKDSPTNTICRYDNLGLCEIWYARKIDVSNLISKTETDKFNTKYNIEFDKLIPKSRLKQLPPPELSLPPSKFFLPQPYQVYDHYNDDDVVKYLTRILSTTLF